MNMNGVVNVVWVCACVCEGQGVYVGCLPPLLSTLFFESLAESAACQLGRSWWPVSLRDPPVPPPVCPAIFIFFMVYMFMCLGKFRCTVWVQVLMEARRP